MCNNCNCEAYNQCSIVGFLPYGFCCSYCKLYDEKHTCLNTKTRRKSSSSGLSEDKKAELRLISSSIEDGKLKVEIGEKNKKRSIYIDLQKHLES